MTSGILVLMATMSFAQVNPESTHLAFKGVPIDGTLQEYVLKMENSGFTHVRTEDGTAVLKGDFALYENCIVEVVTLKQGDLVNKIDVLFPDCETWSSLSSNYSSLKELLTEKYGVPSDRMEKFEGTEPRYDNSRIRAVRFDKCKYHTTFKTEKGSIQLSIEHNGVSSCFVKLAYYDKINGDIIKAKAKGDL